MSKPTDIRLTRVATSTEKFNYRTPMKFGGRVVVDVVLLNVTAEVETRDGRRGAGFGSMPMSNVWAWPTQNVPGEQALQAMIDLGIYLATEANAYNQLGHPLEITHDLARGYARAASDITGAAGLAESMPRLAQLVAASPLEQRGIWPLGRGIRPDPPGAALVWAGSRVVEPGPSGGARGGPASPVPRLVVKGRVRVVRAGGTPSGRWGSRAAARPA